MSGFTIAPADPDAADILNLMEISSAYYAALYPPEDSYPVPPSSLAVFLAARDDESGALLGYGGMAVKDGGAYGEIKRMFVDPSARGRGIGRAILTALEQDARQRALPLLRLETGTLQPEAHALYRAFGYSECPIFGDYRDGGMNIFMEKAL